jgi:hypothetical protein
VVFKSTDVEAFRNATKILVFRSEYRISFANALIPPMLFESKMEGTAIAFVMKISGRRGPVAQQEYPGLVDNILHQSPLHSCV